MINLGTLMDILTNTTYWHIKYFCSKHRDNYDFDYVLLYIWPARSVFAYSVNEDDWIYILKQFCHVLLLNLSP